MSTFQGFKITGIDRNKSPVILDDKVCFGQFYLVLEPIDAAPITEDLTLWGYYFHDTDWEKKSERIRHDKQEGGEVPKLTFVLPDEDEAFICAHGISLQPFRPYIHDITNIVNRANCRFISVVNGLRKEIDAINDAINSEGFGH
jgi:hypothetical protein